MSKVEIWDSLSLYSPDDITVRLERRLPQGLVTGRTYPFLVE